MRTMRPVPVRRIALLGCWTAVLATSLGAQPPHRPAPRFEGVRIPDPPRQDQPWTPPQTRLPGFLIAATATLCEQGLADPRGCEYRAIEVGVGSVWGASTIVRTRGWVLPAQPGDGPRFAVCWNGLVYPVVSVGDEADLEADVRALAEALQKVRARSAERSRGEMVSAFHLGYGAYTEEQAVAVESLLPLKVCLLVRLGHADLAERFWAAGTVWTPDGPGRDLTNYGVSYRSLASDWAWALFDRTVCAHMRGDDRVALDGARRLDRFQRAVAAAIREHDLPRPAGRPPGGEAGPVVDFLGPLPELLADQERRARRPRRGPLPPPGTDKPRRIAALIDRLDEVAVRQSGQPGGIGLGESPLVRQLIQEGEEAVEPLLDVLERDDRLTRSVSFGRDFHRGRSLHAVGEAAFIALANILGTSAFAADVTAEVRWNGQEGRRRLAAAIRAYWQRQKDAPPAERWYRTLADDRAMPEQWLQAAAQIVEPTDRPRTFGVVWSRVYPPRRPGEKVELRGDALRGKQDPSVSELMARRAEKLAGTARTSATDRLYDSEATTMAVLLSQWDAEAARPVLRRLSRQFRAALEDRPQGTTDLLVSNLNLLTQARLRGGDPEALDDYADQMRHVSPQGMRRSLRETLEPLWRNPHHPKLAALAEWMFHDAASPWIPLIDPAQPARTYELRPLIASPMLGVAGFRRYIIERGLTDKSPVGTAWLADNQVKYRRADGGQGGVGLPLIDPDGPEQTPEVPFRVCDDYAWALGGVDGIPPCMPFWPEPRRDEAIAAQVACLEQYGERFAWSPEHERVPSSPFFGSGGRATLAFPPLDHPATAEEVRKGLAIFSLAGQEGEVRIWPLPSRPLKAKWVTLKDYPFRQEFADTRTGRSGTRVEYQQGGQVWQAEELLKDGRRHRYYGFVGPRLARVPAEEIEFPDDGFHWGALANQVDCQVSLPAPPEGGDDARSGFAVGRPLPLTVRLRNRSGLEQRVPTEFFRADPPGGPALRRGIDLSLSIAPEDPAQMAEPGAASPSPAQEELAPSRTTRFTPGDDALTLDVAEAFDAFTLDLNDWFDLTRPGLYRFRITFRAVSGLGEGASNEVVFRLDEAPRDDGAGR